MKNIKYLLVLFVLFASCTNKNKYDREIKNIKAFTKCYDYARWFNPSDESVDIDWDKFLLYGIDKVINLKSEDSLKLVLNDLFKPIVPAVSISNLNFKYDIKKFDSILKNKKLRPTYWQHYGADLGLSSNKYRRFRYNSKNETNNINKLAIRQYLPAEFYRNMKVRIRAYVKVNSNTNGSGELFLSSYSGFAFFSCLHDSIHRISLNKWNLYEEIINVKADDSLIDYGFYMNGDGEIFVDDLELSYYKDGKWHIIFKDDFEGEKISKWKMYFNEFTKKISHKEKYSGNSSLHIKSKGKLFNSSMKYGDIIDEKISDDLKISLPMVLMRDDEHTYPIGDADSKNKLLKSMNDFKSTYFLDNLEEIVQYWSVMNYFSPHLIYRKDKWKNSLYIALSKEMNGESGISYLCNILEDAHTSYHAHYCNQYRMPFYASLIEGKLIVSNSLVSDIKVGDEILEFNNQKVFDVFNKSGENISGGKRYKNLLNTFIWNKVENKALYPIVVKRNGKVLHLKLMSRDRGCPAKLVKMDSVIRTKDYTYLDLSRIDLLNAKKIINEKHDKNHYLIYDLRMMEYMPYALLPDSIRLLNKSQGGQTILRTRPDSFKFTKLGFKPKSLNKISSKIKKNIFLVGPYNISNQESFIDFIHEIAYGVTVGDYTAGANGNMNFINYSSGLYHLFTGERYIYHDGKCVFSKGLKPDYLVRQSLTSFYKNEDDVFNAAVKLVFKKK